MLSRKSSQKMWRRKYSGAMEVQQVLTGSCVKWHVKCQLLVTPCSSSSRILRRGGFSGAQGGGRSATSWDFVRILG